MKLSGKTVKWGLIGIGSAIAVVGGMLKPKPDENLFDEDAENVIEVDGEVTDEEKVDEEVKE